MESTLRSYLENSFEIKLNNLVFGNTEFKIGYEFIVFEEKNSHYYDLVKWFVESGEYKMLKTRKYL